ncbi:conserved hypothetical protein [Hyella patelloides LEGE 07179]|uniref:Uncharacterized protein n=1 Tax=Hyella patelloides LEGE 07179 TaxID=945734 RepID=A0A563VY27_9CYAN|nr:hypothetical protein [Hyella patelloides]VEP16352.1 conserved hypothetical protein [Hyella patelloides LEGE 07179]
MNYTKSNFQLPNANSDRVLTLEKKVGLWLKKFWQFSLFYGDYLASLHSRKNPKL